MAEARIPARLIMARILCGYLPPLLAARVRSLIYPFRNAFNDDYEFVVRAKTGSRFVGRTSDFHAYPFSVQGYYEWRNWALALSLCSPGDTIVEIGANVGTETVGFSDIVGPSGRVFAIEPLPANLDTLRRALSLKNQDNVEIIPFALSDSKRKMEFVKPPKHSSGTGHLNLRNEDLGLRDRVEVECTTLDLMAEDFGAARMVFIDVEGAEPNVLHGAVDYLAACRPHIVLEASPRLLTRAGFSLEDLSNLIRDLGYTVFRIGRVGLVSHDLMRHSASNWLCVANADVAREANRGLRLGGFLPSLLGLNPASWTHFA